MKKLLALLMAFALIPAAGLAEGEASLREAVEQNLAGTSILTSLWLDLDGDGKDELLCLAVPDASVEQGSASYGMTDTAAIGAMRMETGEWLGSTWVNCGEETAVATLDFAGYIAGGIPYLVIRGERGNSISRVAGAVLLWRNGAWEDILSQEMNAGVPYTVAFLDGPKVRVTTEDGNSLEVAPLDLDMYTGNGWVDEQGKIQPTIGNGFDEPVGLAQLAAAVEQDKLVLRTEQLVYAAHKLDTPAKIQAIWTYADGQWKMESAIVPMEKGAAEDVYYHNPDGGRYYHMSEVCESVSAIYLPLRSFPRSALGEDAYMYLTECPYCGGNAK